MDIDAGFYVTDQYQYHGLTKREYFAAMALSSGSTAKDSVLKADALINELNKENLKS